MTTPELPGADVGRQAGTRRSYADTGSRLPAPGARSPVPGARRG
ncbi:hypothetical protein ACFY0A_08410 [Streptomyces sp. NPDC001698]